jgi:hypothetical protein
MYILRSNLQEDGLNPGEIEQPRTRKRRMIGLDLAIVDRMYHLIYDVASHFKEDSCHL